MAVGKGRSPERVRSLRDRALSLKEAGLVCGVCLAGLEKDYPVLPYRETLAELREAGLGITIHAGEWAGPESVWEAGVPFSVATDDPGIFLASINGEYRLLISDNYN